MILGHEFVDPLVHYVSAHEHVNYCNHGRDSSDNSTDVCPH